MNSALARAVLRRPLARRIGDSVQLGVDRGPDGKIQDVFETCIVSDGGQTLLVVDGMCGKGFLGHLPKSDVRACAPFPLVRNRELKFRHFYKGEEWRHDGLGEYLRESATRWYRVHRAYGDFQQWRFNRRQLQALTEHDRMRVLKMIREDVRDGIHEKHSSMTLMLRDPRTFLHPKRRELGAYYELILASLLASGDLERVGRDYKLAPQALKTIDDYDLAERRHRDMRRLQGIGIGVSAVVGLYGIAQLVLALFR